MKTRFLALAIAVMMVFAMMPVGVSAAAETVTYDKTKYYTADATYYNKTIVYEAGFEVMEGVDIVYSNCNVVITGSAVREANINFASALVRSNSTVTFDNTTVSIEYGGTITGNVALNVGMWIDTNCSINVINGSDLSVEGYSATAFQPEGGNNTITLDETSEMSFADCGNTIPSTITLVGDESAIEVTHVYEDTLWLTRDLTFENASVTFKGGIVLRGHTLTFDNCVVNIEGVTDYRSEPHTNFMTVRADFEGGNIVFNDSEVTMNGKNQVATALYSYVGGSKIEVNNSTLTIENYTGAAIYLYIDTVMDVNNSTVILNNNGTGIQNWGGSVSANVDSTLEITNNTNYGISNYSDGTVSIAGKINFKNNGVDFWNDSTGAVTISSGEGRITVGGLNAANIVYTGEPKPTPINFFMYFFMKMFLSEYEITVATEGNGAVVTEAEDLLVQYGNDIVLTPVAEEGAELLSVLVDGVEVELSDAYSFENVKEAHSITFIFSEIVEEEVTEEEVVEEEIVEEVTEEIVDEAADEEVAA